MKKYIFSVLVLFFVVASFASTFYELKLSGSVASNRSFELIHNYITDYNFYLSRIRQGWEGRTTLLEIYTNEPHHGTIIHELYLVLGQLARIIPDGTMAVFYAYHVARFVFGLLLLSLIAYLATRLFKHVFWQTAAFLLVVTGAGWPLISAAGETWRFNNYMPWWTVLEPLQRITFIPHILLAQAGVLFLIVAGSTPETIKRKGNWIFLGVIATITGLAMPQALLTVYGVYSLVTLIEFVLWDGKRTKQDIRVWFKTVVLPRVGICLLSVWTILYFLPLLSVYPWKRLVDFEVLHPIRFSYMEYLKTLGLALPLGILGAGIALAKRDRAWYPIVSWAVGVVGLVYLLTFFPLQHPLRFTEMAAYIPLGLLTGYFFVSCIKWFLHAHTISTRQYGSIGVYTVLFLSIVYGGMTMYHQFLWQKDFVDMKVQAGWPAIAMNNYIVYPVKGFIEGITYIDQHTPKDAIILSSIVAGNYIPARTGRVVYLGHENTSYKEEKIEIAKRFYQGLTPSKEVYQWLHKERISYVFVGPEEKEQASGVDIATVYPFLRQIFANDEVILYAVLP